MRIQMLQLFLCFVMILQNAAHGLYLLPSAVAGAVLSRGAAITIHLRISAHARSAIYTVLAMLL